MISRARDPRPVPTVEHGEEEEGRRDEAPGGDSRSALLEAAFLCFAHQGFDGTSIRDIATKAMRNSSLISYHFGCKEGLYEEVFRQVLHVGKLDPDTGSSGEMPGTREEATRLLHGLIRVLCSGFIVSSKFPDQRVVLGRKLLLSELREPRPRIAALLREHVAPWFRQFSNCLRVLRPELSEAQRCFLGVSIMGEMMAHMMLRGVRPSNWDQEELEPVKATELLTEFNLRALGIQDLGPAGGPMA